MGEISIKIRIADRDYPMRIADEDEERLRLAGRKLNEKLKSYREKFGIDDKQDLLAMAAFDYLSEKLLQEEQYQQSFQDIHDRVDALDKWMDDSVPASSGQ